MKRILAILILLGLAQQANAQTIVGIAIINGDVVDLYADQTWQFRSGDEAPIICNQFHQNVRFCPDPDVWAPSANATLEIAASYNYDARNYGQFVIEDIGYADGISESYVREAVIQIAASAAGIQTGSVEIIEILEATIDGRDAETIVYQLPFNGTNVIYTNSILITENMVLQAMTYHIGTLYNDELRSIHQQFLAYVTVTP